MTLRHALQIALVLSLSSCATIRVKSTVHKRLIRTRTQTDPPSQSHIEAVVTATGDRIDISAKKVEECRTRTVPTIEYQRHIVRTAVGDTIMWELIGGGVGLIGGGVAMGLSSQASDSNPIGEPGSPSERTTLLAGGGAALAIGAGLLIYGIVDSVWARDEITRPVRREEPGKFRWVECKTSPAAGAKVQWRSKRGALGPVGMLDGRGHLVANLPDILPDGYFYGRQPQFKIPILVGGVDTETVSGAGLAGRRVERRFKEATATNGLGAWRTFRRDFPWSPRVADALTAERQLLAAREQGDWAAAAKTKGVVAFEGYLAEHGQGSHARAARLGIVAALAKAGDLQRAEQRLEAFARAGGLSDMDVANAQVGIEKARQKARRRLKQAVTRAVGTASQCKSGASARNLAIARKAYEALRRVKARISVAEHKAATRRIVMRCHVTPTQAGVH